MIHHISSEYPLIKASQNGDLCTVEQLLSMRIDINMEYRGHTAISEDCRCGHLSVVQLLLSKGANIYNTGGYLSSSYYCHTEQI